MEDVLEVYTRPYDPRRPQVCLDETSVQLIGEKRIPVPMAPGRLARFDYEYERNGVCAVFMLNEPLRGWREVVVADQRTAIDFAHVVKHLVDVHYPDAERIVLVMDNLNTHTPGSLYEAFAPTEARRLADKLEIHYTPKHASWLDMAEIELSVLTSQCLDRRIPDKAHAGPRSNCLDARPQRPAVRHRLALHHPRRTHQTQAPLPGDPAMTVQAGKGAANQLLGRAICLGGVDQGHALLESMVERSRRRGHQRAGRHRSATHRSRSPGRWAVAAELVLLHVERSACTIPKSAAAPPRFRSGHDGMGQSATEREDRRKTNSESCGAR